MKKLILLVLAGVITACSHISPAPTSSFYISTIPTQNIDFSEPLTKIAFGSCANQDQPQPLWSDISKTHPDLFLFMGDNVYASHPTQKPISEQYKKLDQIPEYLAIRKEVPFMATWDDHDYGERDGGADYNGKFAAQDDFLNYWQYLKNSLPSEQQGVYHAKVIGPPKKSVQIIMLDTRFFRSPLVERPEFAGKATNYIPQEEGTVLGEEQWQWLEEQLQRPAEVRFIISSIQLIANDPKFEKWGNFPNERERFFLLLKKSRAKNIILLSGDRHIASIAKQNLSGYGPLYEITASSINRPNPYSDNDSHYVGPTYNQENYGLAQIDWKRRLIKVDLLGMGNKVVNTVEIKLK